VTAVNHELSILFAAEILYMLLAQKNSAQPDRPKAKDKELRGQRASKGRPSRRRKLTAESLHFDQEGRNFGASQPIQTKQSLFFLREPYCPQAGAVTEPSTEPEQPENDQYNDHKAPSRLF